MNLNNLKRMRDSVFLQGVKLFQRGHDIVKATLGTPWFFVWGFFLGGALLLGLWLAFQGILDDQEWQDFMLHLSIATLPVLSILSIACLLSFCGLLLAMINFGISVGFSYWNEDGRQVWPVGLPLAVLAFCIAFFLGGLFVVVSRPLEGNDSLV